VETKDGVDGFLAGLIRPSGASLLGMILFAFVEVVVALVLFTPRRMASLPPVILMKNARDDYARVTFLTYRLKYGPRAPLSVVYLGPSTAQRALFDSLEPRPIEARLGRMVGRDVDFYSLYAAGETIEESALLAHQLPAGFRGVVAMVIFEDKDDERSRRLAMEANADLEERLPMDPEPGGAPRVGFDGKPLRRTGIYFLDHLQFFSARRASLLHPWQTWAPLARGGVSLTTPPAYRSEERAFETRYRNNPMPLVRRELDLLADVVDTARARGAAVVLVESPSNPRYQALKGDDHAVYQEKIREFSTQHGAEYWDINPEVHPRRQDFEDAVHLGTSAMRRRFQNVFCSHLAAKLRTLVPDAETNDAPDDEDDD
jgi:hypothetical protein